jgi:hypothetical protein
MRKRLEGVHHQRGLVGSTTGERQRPDGEATAGMIPPQRSDGQFFVGEQETRMDPKIGPADAGKVEAVARPFQRRIRGGVLYVLEVSPAGEECRRECKFFLWAGVTRTRFS